MRQGDRFSATLRLSNRSRPSAAAARLGFALCIPDPVTTLPVTVCVSQTLFIRCAVITCHLKSIQP